MNSAIQDPYLRFLAEEKHQKSLIPYDTSSKFNKKWKKIQRTAREAYRNSIQGGIMGCLVGGLFGFIFGVYQAYKMGRLYIIPVSVLVSGVSFGFILACGSLVRTDDTLSLPIDSWKSVAALNSSLQQAYL